ncbi:hypothetical protein, partial [Microbispora hainanensis]|uniref:hypothetical protein n=1 Tax=Microbispora hainanensis TaxID=568844 RepID=UPI0034067725
KFAGLRVVFSYTTIMDAAQATAREGHTAATEWNLRMSLIEERAEAIRKLWGSSPLRAGQA